MGLSFSVNSAALAAGGAAAALEAGCAAEAATTSGARRNSMTPQHPITADSVECLSSERSRLRASLRDLRFRAPAPSAPDLSTCAIEAGADADDAEADADTKGDADDDDDDDDGVEDEDLADDESEDVFDLLISRSRRLDNASSRVPARGGRAAENETAFASAALVAYGNRADDAGGDGEPATQMVVFVVLAGSVVAPAARAAESAERLIKSLQRASSAVAVPVQARTDPHKSDDVVAPDSEIVG
jgi:hypothetical protein